MVHIFRGSLPVITSAHHYSTSHSGQHSPSTWRGFSQTGHCKVVQRMNPPYKQTKKHCVSDGKMMLTKVNSTDLATALGALVFLPRFSSLPRDAIAVLANGLRILRPVFPPACRRLVKAQILHMLQLPGHFLF